MSRETRKYEYLPKQQAKKARTAIILIIPHVDYLRLCADAFIPAHSDDWCVGWVAGPSMLTYWLLFGWMMRKFDLGANVPISWVPSFAFDWTHYTQACVNPLCIVSQGRQTSPGCCLSQLRLVAHTLSDRWPTICIINFDRKFKDCIFAGYNTPYFCLNWRS